MTEKRKTLIVKRLANEGLKTMEFFRALSDDDWAQPIYSTGSKWTPREILCHFLSAEQGFHHLVSDILLGGQGAPEGMVIDAFNEQQILGMNCEDTNATMEAFAQARVTTIEIVRQINPEDLDRQGRHPYFGITSIEKMLKLIYRHTMIHQRDIRQALEQEAPVDRKP